MLGHVSHMVFLKSVCLITIPVLSQYSANCNISDPTNSSFYVIARERGDHEQGETPIWAVAHNFQRFFEADVSHLVHSYIVDGDAMHASVKQLHSVLLRHECQLFLKTLIELGYHDVAAASKKFSRLSGVQNVNLVMPEDLTSLLFQRIRHHLPKDPWGNEAVGINSLIRSFAYSKGGEFVEHYDSEKPWTKLAYGASGGLEMVEEKDHMSKFTLLLFLNDDYKGGATRFLSRHGGETIHTDVWTAAGGAIIFPHGTHPLTMWHAGAPVEEGVKYVIRTQIHYPSSLQDSQEANHALSATAQRYHPQSVEITENGHAVDLTFADGAAYRFRAAWLHDSVRTNWDHDNNRKYDSQSAIEASIKTAKISVDKTMLQFFLKAEAADGHESELPTVLLRACGEVSAKPVQAPRNMSSPPRRLPHSPLLSPAAQHPWDGSSKFQIGHHTFHYKELIENYTLRLEFLRKLNEPGFALLKGLPEVSKEDFEARDDPVFEQVVSELAAPFETQRRQKHNYHTIVSFDVDEENKMTSVEFDDRKRLDVHTDRSSHGSHGSFVAAFHMQQGSGVLRLVDGYRVSNYLKEEHTKYWEILTSTPVGHGFENRCYSETGQVRDMANFVDKSPDFALYGDVPGHIELDPDGHFKRITFSHRKRGIAEVEYDKQHLYFRAVELLSESLENKEFELPVRLDAGMLLILNNHRVLHGRGEVLKRPRVLSGGYIMLPMIEGQLRLLTSRVIAEAVGLPGPYSSFEMFLSKVSNGVLAQLFEDTEALQELRDASIT